MVSYPLSALRSSAGIGRIIVCAQQPGDLAEAVADGMDVELRVSEGSIARTVDGVLRALGGPLLVTTADHVLLTPAMIDNFLQEARGCDLAIAMVERRTMRRAGLDSRRTWLPFRGGQWSGANLFWLNGPESLPLVRFWSEIEQERKKGRKIIAAFGPVLALSAALRLAGIHSLVRRAGRRFGLEARVVAMPQGEACIDADKPADIALIERLLAERAA